VVRSKNNFLCQLQSDIIQTEIARPEVDETTALGSAYAAGLAVGYWDTVDELRDNWQIDREFTPEKRTGRGRQAVQSVGRRGRTLSTGHRTTRRMSK